MSLASNYWILVKIDSFGRCQTDVLEEAKAFFKEQFPALADQKNIPDSDIQNQLFQWYGSSDPCSRMAEQCLRCFISNIVKVNCAQLEQKYGEKHDLSSAELLPLVLDSSYRSNKNFQDEDTEQSFTEYILETFDPQKGSLLSWVTTIFRRYSTIKQSLKEHGIVQKTDWAILSDTTSRRLKRILSHLQSTPKTIIKLEKLLNSFHQVYRTQLHKYRKPKPDSKFSTSKYPQPATEQLNQIAKILNEDTEYNLHRQIISSEEVLQELQKLAKILRENWIKSQQKVSETYGNETTPNLPEYCVEPFNNCLCKSVEQVIKTRLDYIQRKGTEKGKEQAKKYFEALHLFHCDGVALTKIASQLGFTDQPHLSRLLKLKTLRKDIGRNLILNLKSFVEALNECYQNPEKLVEIDSQIQELFGPGIDELIKNAEKEARNGHRLAMNSQLAQAICQYLNQCTYLNY